jgi:hypothetical protein
MLKQYGFVTGIDTPGEFPASTRGGPAEKSRERTEKRIIWIRFQIAAIRVTGGRQSEAFEPVCIYIFR